jgi:hypothetical protein
MEKFVVQIGFHFFYNMLWQQFWYKVPPKTWKPICSKKNGLFNPCTYMREFVGELVHS